jgi:hypothetical protein
MNFAFGSTGVFRISPWINIREQVDNFKTMVKSGTISKNHVSHSPAPEMTTSSSAAGGTPAT